MDSKNSKKEKVGADGLSKKERRALKVQARGPTSSGVQDAPEKPDSASHFPAQKDDKENAKAEINGPKQLTEKELRKLDWEKKLAEQKTKEGTKDSVAAAPSKAELKIKRREKQEADRLAKAAAAPVAKADVLTKLSQPQPKSEPAATVKPTDKSSNKKVFTRKSPVKTGFRKNIRANKVQLVEHLYIEKPNDLNFLTNNKIHPAFIKLGAQYANKTIVGSNSRCLALLAALKHLINDVQTPPKQEFCRYLETVIKMCTDHIQACRPMAVSMTNALRQFKFYLTQVDTNWEDNNKRLDLQTAIDTYIKDDIQKAGEAISLKVRDKIANGDVILTYGCSSLITRILLDAHKDRKEFAVIVTDGRPLLEGREMLRRLVCAGIECRYVHVNAVGYVMSSVTKVVFGAHALLTNGYVMSRIGTAQVALVASAYNKPVLVCCETYKFSERVQTDSFVYNEIDNPEQRKGEVKSKVSSPLSNLLYDVTPPDFVTAVFTEKAIIPCTSVPVVLRINAS